MRASILRMLCRDHNLSRIDIADRLRVDMSTISLAVKKLMEEGIVCERGSIKAHRGRPKTRLAIAEDLVVCSVEVAATGVTAAVVDLFGRILTLKRTYYSPGLENLPAFLRTMIDELRHSHPLRIEGIGITLADALAADAELCSRLKADLEKRLGLYVEVQGDMQSMLLGESLFGSLAGIGSAVLLHVSDTVRATLVSQGKLPVGAAEWSGQIAHIVVAPEGPVCACGQRGCLNSVASSAAVLEQYRVACGADAPAIGIDEFHSRVEDGDAIAIAVLTSQAEALAAGLRTLLLMAVPEVVLVAGPVVRSWHIVEPILRRAVHGIRAGNHGVAIHRNTNPEQMQLLGAAAIVLGRNQGERFAA